MKKTLLFTLTALFASTLLAHAADPLRVFIRAGEKTHAPGAHEYPKFLEEWSELLEARGCKVDGALAFPTREQLENTDVLILHSKEAGNINIGTERKNLEAFIKRGGGLVVIHGGAVSRTDPDYYKSIIGGSWRFGTTKWLEAPMSLYFTDRDNPITKDISNFDIEDEIYYDMDLRDDISVLAAAYTPKAIDTGGRGNKEAQARAADAVAKKKAVNIYDIQPQIWTYENTLEGGTEPYRAFVHIPGHWYENFDHNGVRTLLLRGIAWAGKRDNVDEFCKAEELGDALRYVEGGVPRPEKLPDYLEVHPDFELSLVASEPLINNPMNIDWDEQGRLWVCETPEYPNGLRQANVETWKDSGSVKPGIYDRDPLDRISILTDTNNDGVMDEKHVFADKLELATSFVLHKNGAIVCSAPDIWLLEDTNGDEVADKRTRLYTNLGTRDTHAVINNMRWGRDGWIYATHGYSSTDNVTNGDGSQGFGPISMGVVRFKPDGSAFEQFASKGGNTWGLETTSDGEVFYTQPTTGNPLVHVVLPEYILAQGKAPGVAGTLGLLPDEATFPAMNWEQQAYVQIDQVGRYTAGAGCVIYEGGAWPEKWNRSYFTSEPTLNIVGHFFTEKDGVTYTANKEPGREETEFIRSTNLWFRPIEVRTGPDGALYLVDFCNQAIIHNDTRGPTHGPANAAVRPDRDHYYGRIWRVQHKDAKPIPPLALDRTDLASLGKAVQSPNKVTREVAARLLREQGKGTPQTVGSAAVRTYENALTETDLAAIAAQARDAKDDWTLSAIIAATADRAPQAIEAAFQLRANDSLINFATALTPVALRSNPSNVAKLLQSASNADASAAPVQAAVLRGLADNTADAPALSGEIKGALEKLLETPRTAPLVLPLIAKWDTKGEMKDRTMALTMKLIAELRDDGTPDRRRLEVARSLIDLRAINPQVRPAFITALSGDAPAPFKRELLTILGNAEGPDIGALIIEQLPGLPPNLQSTAVDQILKRALWSQKLLGLLEKGEITPADLGPANVARLRTHPSKQVARRANLVLDKISPESVAKNELLAKLTPEVTKPGGDPAKGKLLYSACAICHKLGDLGVEVGPALDGMGAHGPGELLVHILDPNREVDPSFWAHNITTNKGEAFSGVITSENAASITLATQIGVKELSKAEITKRENTRRSLMPEGFEALGPEALRDLLAYICGEAAQQFRIIDLSQAYTADSRTGLFANNTPGGGVLQLPQTGNLSINGVPFLVQEPKKSRTGANLVVLKGGPRKEAYSQTFPQSVEVDVNVAAKKLHLLSGIGGWAFPAIRDKNLPVLKVEVIYEGGDRETFVMKNGVEFADYIRKVDVPGSAFVEELSKGTQVRWITLDLKKSGTIKKLVLSSFDNAVAPVLVAATADIAGTLQPQAQPAKQPAAKTITITINAAATPRQPGPAKGNPGTPNAKKKGKKSARPGPPPPLPPTPVKWEDGKTKVLLIGGGSSHDFPKYFGAADSATLEKAGLTTHYTEDRAQATKLLAEADVAIISVNRKLFDTLPYRKALMDRIDAGKGVIMLHPGTWYGYQAWPELNAQVVGGGSRGHDKLGPYRVEVADADHPIMKDVPASFEVIDELYYMNAVEIPEGTLPIKVLAKTTPSQKYGVPHPSVWTVENPKARIAGIALGHDDRVHDLKPYQSILINAAHWAAGK